MLADAVRFIHEHNDILLIAHVSPDGDTLGSSFALYGALRAMGKHVQVVCEDPVPNTYAFLPFSNTLIPPEQAQPAEAVICVDCADVARAGRCEPLFHAAKSTLNIDHHGTNESYAAFNYVKKSAATGELIYRLLTELKCPVDRDVASCLYAAIATDTGNFSYSNTTPDTFRVSAELLDVGIDLPDLSRRLFRTIPFHKLKLQALAIDKTRLYEDGRIGIAYVTLDEIASCGAKTEDTEGIIDLIRDIASVEIAVFLRESEDGAVRVSLRGKTCGNVSKIATQYHGGGHKLAAGCTLQTPIAQAAELMLAAAKQQLQEDCG
jgi:phosphoesterase RecJ-like protein